MVANCAPKPHFGAFLLFARTIKNQQTTVVARQPAGFDGEIFDLLFSSADLHNFAPDDKIKYLNDMTTERDIRNQIAFAKDKGFEEGREEERERIVTALRDQGISEEIIAKVSESKR